MKSLCIAALLALSTTAWSADEHGHAHKPLHGGLVAEAGAMEVELVAKADVVTLHLRDHKGKPLSAQGGAGKLTVLSGSQKVEATLAPAGDNRLEARGTFAVGAGTKFVAAVTLPGQKPANLRFAVK